MTALSMTLFIVCTLTTAAAIYFFIRLRSSAHAQRVLSKLSDKLEADLADRRAIERELAHMASFADMAPQPIVEINKDHSLGYLNPAAEKAFPTLTQQGLKHAALEGLIPIITNMAREQKSLLTRPIKIEDRIYEQQISLLDGGPRVRLYMSDITELKRLDQLKSDFVNMVSHELRSPLTSIGASIKMISSGVMGAVSEDQIGMLKLAEVNIDRLARMINELLDVSKIEAGKLEIHRARVDLSKMVKQVVRSFEPLAKERGLEMRSRLSQDAIQALVDPDKILQVFTNLINNALKFTQKGFVEIIAEEYEGEVRCQVVDTGPGISSADLPKVFGKFQQFGARSHSKEKGTGLGLSLCKGLVELHGGRIWVESERDKGTQFIFVLPQLSTEDVFKSRIQDLFVQAVATSQSLSLLRLTPRGWPRFRQGISDDQVGALATQIQEFMQLHVRSECDLALEGTGDIFLALVDVSRSDAVLVVQKIQEIWPHSALVQKSGLPESFDVRIASYPEDGTLPDTLFARLTAA
jgi:signal transduction histidine kinase